MDWWTALAKFVGNPITTVVSVIFGMVGTLLTYWSFRKSRRTDKIYSQLFEVAEKNIDKTVTQNELSQKRREVQAASEQIRNLQEQIRKDIPLQARRAVLMDRLDSQIEHLQQSLDSTLTTKRELAELRQSVDIPPELLKAIESEISPQYRLKNRRESLRTYLLIILAVAAVVPAVAPWRTARYGVAALLATACLFLVLLVRYSIRVPRAQLLRWAALAGSMLLLITGGFVSLLSGAVVVVDITNHRVTGSPQERLAFIVTFVVGLAVTTAAVIILRRLRKPRQSRWAKLLPSRSSQS